LKPLAANVLICPADALADKTESVEFAGSSVAVTAQEREGSSILTPGKSDKVQSKPSEGIVRSLGDDVKIKVKEGDRVLYRSWTGLEVRIKGKGETVFIDHQITPERDVLAIVDEGETVEVIQRPIPQPAPQQRR
jgi:co-chaperonin GroES (HSP10)